MAAERPAVLAATGWWPPVATDQAVVKLDNVRSSIGSPPDSPYAVEVEGLLKVYGPTVALAGANLTVRRGEIHGLLGENGSGKSTLVRILAGIETPDGGRVDLFGRPIGEAEDSRRARRAFIHQDLGLIQSMSIADNIALAAGYPRVALLIDDRSNVRNAEALLARLDVKLDTRAPVGELPLADQTVVAIARALAHGVDLIVLDEPTAYLEARQVRGILALLRRLRDQGVACLLITHRASDVLAACDRVTVLREGRAVLEGIPVEGMAERDLVKAISGHDPAAKPPTLDRTGPRTLVLSVLALQTDGLEPLSMEIGEGEIVGLCGLADAGAEEVGKAIFGLSRMTGGEMILGGQRIRPNDPARSIRAGVAYVPRERRESGLADTLSARENLFSHFNKQWFRIIRSPRERVAAHELLKLFGVDPPESERAIGTFSGGNQQKILLAKWINASPKLLILNDPTAGVDLRAKAEIHLILARMCRERQFGVLLISSDFQEITDLSDRIYVMRRRRFVGDVEAQGTTAQALIDLAYGGDAI